MGIEIGSLYVRRSILIQAPSARIWDEFQSIDQVRSWLGVGQQVHDFELALGAVVRLSVDIDGEARHFGGRILILDEGKELTFENQWQSPHEWPVPTFWTIRLTPLYAGTLVEMFHHGFERLGTDAADNLQGYEEGWTVKHLKELRNIVELRDA